MRLLLSISSLAAGGAERVMAHLAGHWTGAGHDVVLCTNADAGAPPHYVLDQRVRLRSVDPGKRGLARQVAVVTALRSALRRECPDAVISFLNYTNILTLMAARGLGMPVIVSERLDPRVIGIGPAWGALRRWTYPGAARLVAQTPTAARLYAGLSPVPVAVIPNPVPPFGAAPAPDDDWPLSHSRAIIAVGRLQRQKGFDLAIEAMARIADARPDWRLIILGEGPLRGDLEALRDRLGLADRVLLPGRVPDPGPWLARADIFVMSSRSEGFPNALCEAMAAGLAVVSTDCPSGPSDIITPGQNGLLVPPEDIEALATTLAELTGSAELRSRLALAAPGITERFAPERILRLWDDLLAQVVADRPDRRNISSRKPRND